MPYMHVPRRSPRQEYRSKQRELIEASPSMAEKFPRLKALAVTLEFFDPTGSTKQGEMKCKLNVEQAKSALWFGCPGVECICGDFGVGGGVDGGARDVKREVPGAMWLVLGEGRGTICGHSRTLASSSCGESSGEGFHNRAGRCQRGCAATNTA